MDYVTMYLLTKIPTLQMLLRAYSWDIWWEDLTCTL